eukprot:10630781-Alexandrium_andersonii.AAC.1
MRGGWSSGRPTLHVTTVAAQRGSRTPGRGAKHMGSTQEPLARNDSEEFLRGYWELVWAGAWERRVAKAQMINNNVHTQ